MSPIKIISLVSAFVAAACLTIAFTPRRPATANSQSAAFVNPASRKPVSPSPATPGFAVVELFTSEGCSSCPAADDLVARVQKEDKDQPVYILAFHVDYWNRLGWKDVFSNETYTDRQRQYANWLRLESVYTPQIVVNGQKEFVGSQASTLRSTIEKDLQGQASPVRLTVTNLKKEDKQLEWTWQTEGAPKGLSLMVALVQQSAVTNVRAGENSGRTLSHVQIVRNFQMAALNGKTSGTGHMDWPAGVTKDGTELIAFLQNEENGQIVAATRAAN